MSVHYKFKSALDYDTVTFDGLHISVKDLKNAIIQQKRIGKNTDFELQVTNAQTKQVYDDENALIPKNTSLLIARIPTVAQNKNKQWEGYGGDSTPPTKLDEVGPIAKATDLSSLDAPEGDKIKAMMTQSTQDYDPSNYLKIRGANQMGAVPPNYRCYKCHQTGHWIKDCPLSKGPEPMEIKKSTGIPLSFMVPVEGPQVQGAMMTPNGSYAVPALDHQTYTQKQTVHAPVEEPKPEIPEDLLCSICSDLLTDAVMIPCCGNSFCDECIRSFLLDSEDHECPDCHEKEISPGTLIPNRFLRTSVANFKNTTGYVKKPIYKQALSRHSEVIKDDKSINEMSPVVVDPVEDEVASKTETEEKTVISEADSTEHASKDEPTESKEKSNEINNESIPEGPPGVSPVESPKGQTITKMVNYTRERTSSKRHRSKENSPRRQHRTHRSSPQYSDQGRIEERPGTPTVDEPGMGSNTVYPPPDVRTYPSAPTTTMPPMMSVVNPMQGPPPINPGYPSSQNLGTFPPTNGPPPNFRLPPPGTAPPPYMAPGPYQVPPRPIYDTTRPPIPGPTLLYNSSYPSGRSHHSRDYMGSDRRMRGRTPSGVIDDPLAAFNRMLREKDERERRAKRNMRRSYSRSRSRSRSYSRSPRRMRSRSPRRRQSRSRSRSFSISRSRSRSFSGSLRGSPFRDFSPRHSPRRRGPSRYRSPIRSPPRHRFKDNHPSDRFRDDEHHDRDRDRDRDRDYIRDDHRGYSRDRNDHRERREIRDERDLHDRNRDNYYDGGGGGGSIGGGGGVGYEERGSRSKSQHRQHHHSQQQQQQQQQSQWGQRSGGGGGLSDGYYQPEMHTQHPYPSNRYPPPPRDYPLPPHHGMPPSNQPPPRRFDDVAPPGVEEPPIPGLEPLRYDDRFDRFDRATTHPNTNERYSSPLREQKKEEERKYIEKTRESDRKRKHDKKSHSPDKRRSPSQKRRSKTKDRESPDKHKKRRRESADKEKKTTTSDDEKSKKNKDKKKKKEKKDSDKKKRKEKKEKHKKDDKEKKHKDENTDESKEPSQSEQSHKSTTSAASTQEQKPVEEQPPQNEQPNIVESKNLYDEALLEGVDTNVVENYGKVREKAPENNPQSSPPPSPPSQPKKVQPESFPKELEEDEKDILEIHPTDLDFKTELETKNEMLAHLPEKSKWEVDEEVSTQLSPKDYNKSEGGKTDKSGKVTNEVLKRAENAIFAKAINAIRPIEIKKISTDRAKLYSGDNPKEEMEKVEEIEVRSAVVEERSSSKKVEVPTQPTGRVSVKDRLGVKVDDNERVIKLDRNKSKSVSPFSRRGNEMSRNFGIGERRVEVVDRRRYDRSRERHNRREDNRREDRNGRGRRDFRDIRRDNRDRRDDMRKDDKKHDRRERSRSKNKNRPEDDPRKDKRRRSKSRSDSEEHRKRHKNKDKKIKKDKVRKHKDDEENVTAKPEDDSKDVNVPKPKPSVDKRKATIDEANFEPDYDLESESEKEDAAKKENKDAKAKVEEKSSDSSDSSDSSSDDEKRKKKHKKHRKKKSRRDSSSSSSESESESSDEDRDKRRKKHKKKQKKKKRSKHK